MNFLLYKRTTLSQATSKEVEGATTIESVSNEKHIRE